MPETQGERDRERDQKRSAGQQPCEPGIEPLERPEQELEVDPSEHRLNHCQRAHPSPTPGIARTVIIAPTTTITEAEIAGSAPAKRAPNRRRSGLSRATSRPP